MARHEQQREDLLGDAVAFIERAVFSSDDYEEVFVGFRSSGAVSVYVDQDPVYHFNSSGELRRGFLAGELLKAKAGKLVAMRRERPGGEVQLVSRELSAADSAELLEQARRLLQTLRQDLQNQTLRVVGQVPEGGVALRSRIVEWMQEIVAKPIEVARTPHAR